MVLTMPDYTDQELDEMYGPGASAYGFANAPANFPPIPEQAAPAAPAAPITPPGVVPRGVVNPGNWVYASSRYANEPPIPWPDNPPDVGQQPYGVSRFDLPSGVKAFYVHPDYRDRQLELGRQAEAARIARDQAAEDARMMDQAMRAAHSMKDIEAAQRSIQVMRGMRQLQAGAPLYQVARENPLMFGSQLGATLRATAPVAAPTFGRTPSGAEYGLDARGGIHFTPGTGQGPAHQLGDRIPVRGPNGEDLGYVVATGPQTGHYQKPEGIELNASQQISVQRARITAINAQLANAFTIKDSKERDKFISDKTAELDNISKTLTEMPKPRVAPPPGMGATGAIHPMPTTKAELVSGQIYDTSRGAARWDGSKFKLVETR